MIQYRICKTCQENKPLSEYKIRSNNTPDIHCRICINKYNSNRYHTNPKIKERVLQAGADRAAIDRHELHCYKAKIGCLICGEKDPRCLDFHHRNPKKKTMQVPDMWHRYGKQSGLKEAAKCHVLCANCHKKHHVKMRIQTESDGPIIGDYI